MRGKTGMIIMILIRVIFFAEQVRSQNHAAGIIPISWLPDSIQAIGEKTRSRLIQELEYSLSTSLLFFMNWQQAPASNHVDLFQNLKYRIFIGNENSFSFSNNFDHNLGIQCFFDSISGINIDDNTLTTRLNYNFRKMMSVVLNSTVTTRILNGYDYSYDSSGVLTRVLNSSFLTPLIWSFSMGLGFTFKRSVTLTFEFSSARLTYIRDCSVFRQRDITVFYGVPEGRNHLFEYGLGLQLIINTQLFKMLRWEGNIRIFRTWLSPVDLNVNNKLELRILKYLKIGMRTRIIYEPQVRNRVQMENLLSLGFSIKI